MRLNNMAEKKKINLDKMNFEESLMKLEEIVEKLGDGKVDLEEMVSLYQEGVMLKEHCNKKLLDAKMKVEVILKKEEN
jgi:exodeoxyribonuclease VII small subunit